MNCSHSAGAEGSGGTSALTAGPAGHLVNFNNHPDLCYPLHAPQLSLPHCLPSSWEQLFLQILADFKPRAQSPRWPRPICFIHPSIHRLLLFPSLALNPPFPVFSSPKNAAFVLALYWCAITQQTQPASTVWSLSFWISLRKFGVVLWRDERGLTRWMDGRIDR